MAFTKQGVRDLNSLPSKSSGRKLPMPPKEATVCDHKDEQGRSSIREIENGWYTYCLQCGKNWHYGE